MRILTMLFVLLLFSTSTRAFQPDEGWWFNASEPGRGWNMEYQNGLMFVSTFIYSPNGQQLWYTSTGAYNPSTRTFSGTFDLSSGGQCFGCPYRAPQTVVGSGGPVTINFTSAVSARLTHAGGTIDINRFNFNFPTTNSLLYGAWAITRQSVLTDGELLIFDGSTVSNGTEFITGRREGTSRLALGGYNASLNRVAILLDSSTSFYEFWVIDMTFDKMEGRGWLYLKTGNPTGNGDPTFGFRIGYRNDPLSFPTGDDPSDHDGFNSQAASKAKSQGEMPADLQMLERELRVAMAEHATAQ